MIFQMKKNEKQSSRSSGGFLSKFLAKFGDRIKKFHLKIMLREFSKLYIREPEDLGNHKKIITMTRLYLNLLENLKKY